MRSICYNFEQLASQYSTSVLIPQRVIMTLGYLFKNLFQTLDDRSLIEDLTDMFTSYLFEQLILSDFTRKVVKL